jgi:hypothetical protein
VKRYRLYGLDLVSDLPFTHPLPELEGEPESGRAEVRFDLLPRGAVLPGEEAPGARVVYRSPERAKGGESVLVATRAGNRTLLRFAGVAEFSVALERIAARPEGPDDPRLPAVVELRLLGPVLALRLESSGVAALHASAVAVDGRAVAFLSANRGGKTTLATSLMAVGAPLLTDDVLPVQPPAGSSGDFLALPGYPQVRAWPADAERLLAQEPEALRGLARVHPAHEKLRVPVGPDGLGRFEPSPRPLARIYLPERRNGGPVSIAPVPPREALIALVRHSFLPRLVEALGWAERRLELLARLVEAVPVSRLVYPGGAERLEAVRRVVLADAGS